MRIALFAVCFAYWLLLTALLLVSNPAGLVGLQSVPIFPWGKFGVHLIAFTGMGFLANAAQGAKRFCWPLFLALVAYGVTTESLQVFVRHRSARVIDGIENILGIAVGSGLYWLAVWLLRFVRRVKPAATLNDPVFSESEARLRRLLK
ncbi:MAG: VanZ family protein [Planctomycetaceae bacterium]|nr:VanZ family protein [Planctomycetaceae bacterium]